MTPEEVNPALVRRTDPHLAPAWREGTGRRSMSWRHLTSQNDDRKCNERTVNATPREAPPTGGPAHLEFNKFSSGRT